MQNRSRARSAGALIAVLLVILPAACAKRGPTGGSPSQSPGGTSPLSMPAMKLAVLKAVGGSLAYCDPDQFPLPRGAPTDEADGRLDRIKRDKAAFAAILRYEHLRADQDFTDQQVIAIIKDYNQMQAIRLKPVENGLGFTLLVPIRGTKAGTEIVSGTVSRFGTVTIVSRRPGRHVVCPICLAAGDRVATPLGQVRVEDITVGMPVWTTDRSGRRIAGVVLETGRTRAPFGHHVVRITLADGRTLVASPGHPTADGRALGSLRTGDLLDGTRVVAVASLDYSGGFTFDLLPSGPTGAYFVNDVLLRSTLSAMASRPSA